MPIAQVQHEPRWSIRLEGEITLACAAELKKLLLGWLVAGKDLELDLEGATEIDVTILQLLAAAGSEAVRRSVRIGGRASQVVLSAARDAGFDQIPGFPAVDRA
jgi:anti-anti-sigma regulatory factor